MSNKSMHALFGCLFATHVLAADIQIIGHIEQSIPSDHGRTKTITLENYELSDRAQRVLMSPLRGHPKLSMQKAARPHLPNSVQLGMNDIPVLEQGRHGTCVTFAVTAALDATLNKGQYTSLLCLLRLGQYLERTNWVPSGWEGFGGAIILIDRIKQNGIISLENQGRHGCGGVFAYPTNDAVPEGDMSLKTYRQYHEDLSADQVMWSFLWSKYGFLFEEDAVEKTKIALSKRNRVMIALILPRVYLGVAGATGKHHAPDDTWVLSSEIENSIHRNVAGHELVITGYDNKAFAIDHNGNKHRGLFTARNSWGPEMGDEGNFYISYDYYSWLAMEAIQIGTPVRPN